MSAREKRMVRITGERDIYLHLSNPEHHARIAMIGRALSSPVRLKILDILKNTVRSLKEIADLLDIPLSSAALHIKVLEEAHLVVTESQPGSHGSMRVCTCSLNSFHLETFNADTDSVNKMVSIEMPVGNYYTCDVMPTCGLADENGIIDAYDTVSSFYSPSRMRAQILWFSKGFVEYRFPNICNPLLTLEEISFRLELCSEAPGYMENWPSDISVEINGIEVGVYHSPGEYGARRGKLTPSCWPNGSAQYGMLKTFSVREKGGYLDGMLINPDIGLEALEIGNHHYISLKILVKEDARHAGGVNIFGEKYGDYPQGIIMNLTYQ